jgi:hypothetical protein
MSTPEDIAAKYGLEGKQNSVLPSAPSTWRPVDLTEVANGTHKPLQPVVGARDDGIGLFYPGRLHTVTSESEGGKTWALLLAAVQEIAKGEHVVFIDPEDDEASVVGRMLLLGAEPAHILERFHYIRPEEPLGPNAVLLDELLGDIKPSFAVVDGVTEAMVMHGLNPLDNADCAKFGRMLPRRLAACGAAVAASDHVRKDGDSSRYSIGAVHKLNGLNGAAYVLENKEAFGFGRSGTSRLYLAKDRPGQLRRHSRPSKAGLFLFGEFVMESLEGGVHNHAYVRPAEIGEQSMPFRPTLLMQRVSDTLIANPAGLSQNAVETLTTGKASGIRTALELLVNEAYVIKVKNVHKSVKPFSE